MGTHMKESLLTLHRGPKPHPKSRNTNKTQRLHKLSRKSALELLPPSLWHESGSQRTLFRKTCSDELFYFGWIFFGWIFLLSLHSRSVFFKNWGGPRAPERWHCFFFFFFRTLLPKRSFPTFLSLTTTRFIISLAQNIFTQFLNLTTKMNSPKDSEVIACPESEQAMQSGEAMRATDTWNNSRKLLLRNWLLPRSRKTIQLK